MTKMTHPDSKQTIDVAPGSVANYAANGWVAKVAKAAEAKPAKGDDK